MTQPQTRPTSTSQTAPKVTPVPEASISLEDYWIRLRLFRVVWGMDQLHLLPAIYRDDPFFGVNDALKSEDATAPLLRGFGASFDRVEVRWDETEPTPSNYDFARMDRLMSEADRWHMSVVAVVVGAPAWAVDRPTRQGRGPPSGLDEPVLLADGEANPRNAWAAFIATVARRYRGRVAGWEVWNEPNFRDFWQGTPADYAKLYASARMSIRREDPGSAVLFGGMVVDDGSFLRATLRYLCPSWKCPADSIDAVAWHTYGDPRDVSRMAKITRDAFRPYDVRPSIWITEANVPVDDPKAPADALVGPESVSLDEQAAFIIRLFALARASDVKAVAIYRSIDVDEDRHYWGLFRSDWTPRPSLLAFETAARWLSHTEYVGTDHPTATTTVIRFGRGAQNIVVAWNDSSVKQSVDVRSEFNVGMLVSTDGVETPAYSRAGAFRLSLPSAGPHRPASAPLGLPVILITGSYN